MAEGDVCLFGPWLFGSHTAGWPQGAGHPMTPPPDTPHSLKKHSRSKAKQMAVGRRWEGVLRRGDTPEWQSQVGGPEGGGGTQPPCSPLCVPVWSRAPSRGGRCPLSSDMSVQRQKEVSLSLTHTNTHVPPKALTVFRSQTLSWLCSPPPDQPSWQEGVRVGEKGELRLYLATQIKQTTNGQVFQKR